jgi:integrase/recombinase XerD
MDEALEIFKNNYMLDDRSCRTLAFHLENLAVFDKYLAPTLNGSGVTSAVLEDYKMDMRHRNLKKNTINGRIKTLRVFFRILKESGYTTSDPAAGLKTIKGPKPDIVPFTGEQILALFAQPDTTTFVGLRDRMIMQILLDTGIRLDELCGLDLESLDLKKCSLRVLGKGRKLRAVMFGSETAKAIRKYLHFTGITDGYLILSQDGLPLQSRSVQERITIYAKAAGIKGVRPSPHTFRHTFAKMFLMNGGDPYVLRDLLGHETMSTVIIYLKLFRDDLHKKYQGKSPVDRLTFKKRGDYSSDR